jgi:hypothetical protein
MRRPSRCRGLACVRAGLVCFRWDQVGGVEAGIRGHSSRVGADLSPKSDNGSDWYCYLAKEGDVDELKETKEMETEDAGAVRGGDWTRLFFDDASSLH